MCVLHAISFTVREHSSIHYLFTACRERLGDTLLRQLKVTKVTEEQLREAETQLTPDDGRKL